MGLSALILRTSMSLIAIFDYMALPCARRDSVSVTSFLTSVDRCNNRPSTVYRTITESLSASDFISILGTWSSCSRIPSSGQEESRILSRGVLFNRCFRYLSRVFLDMLSHSSKPSITIKRRRLSVTKTLSRNPPSIFAFVAGSRIPQACFSLY
jgi:hypothetical protein